MSPVVYKLYIIFHNCHRSPEVSVHFKIVLIDPPNIQPLKSHRGVFIQPSSVPQLTNLKSYEENLVRLELAEQEKEAELTSMTSMTPVTSDLMEACPSPLRLAQQLTHVELERFSMIGPEEFVQAFHKEISDDVSEGLGF